MAPEGAAPNVGDDHVYSITHDLAVPCLLFPSECHHVDPSPVSRFIFVI
jgi:hypothetical protein